MSPPGRVLAIDPGRVRIGLAISDPLRIIAQPLPTVRAPNRRKSLEAIAAIVEEQGVSEIVVGRPLGMDGRETAMTEFSERYGRDLGEMTSRPVRFWDERLTSVAAERTLLEANVSRADRTRLRDAVAAVLILQGYLELASSESPT